MGRVSGPCPNWSAHHEQLLENIFLNFTLPWVATRVRISATTASGTPVCQEQANETKARKTLSLLYQFSNPNGPHRQVAGLTRLLPTGKNYINSQTGKSGLWRSTMPQFWTGHIGGYSTLWFTLAHQDEASSCSSYGLWWRSSSVVHWVAVLDADSEWYVQVVDISHTVPSGRMAFSCSWIPLMPIGRCLYTDPDKDRQAVERMLLRRLAGTPVMTLLGAPTKKNLGSSSSLL